MLYTYTDDDTFTSPIMNQLLDSTNSSIDHVNYVGEAYMNNGKLTLHDNIRNHNYKRLKTRFKKEGDSYSDMYICFATDVDLSKLRSGVVALNPHHHFKEHILCSIRYHFNGLIEISPGISEICIDSSVSNVNIPISMSAVMDTKSIMNGFSQGYLLSKYTVKSRSGSSFEYTIENSNEIVVPNILKEIRENDYYRDLNNWLLNSGNDPTNNIESNWKQDPPAKGFDCTYSFFGEIVSGYGFENDNCYVCYEVLLPENWVIRKGNLSDGVAERDFLNQETVASSKKTLSLLVDDGFSDGLDSHGMLQGSTPIVTSNRDFSYKFTCRPTFHGINYILPMTSRLIFAVSFFAITILSILVGFEYPFWIVPFIVFFITLITGVPGNSKAQIYKYSKSLNLESKSRFGSIIDEEVYNFNYVIKLSFDYVRLSDSSKISHPQILFEVYSVGWFDRHRLEGYGHFNLPQSNQSIDSEIRTWRPKHGVFSEMSNHFLGSSRTLKDSKFIYPDLSSQVNPVGLNKFGFQSETSGTIRFRCNTIISDPKLSLKFKNEQTVLREKSNLKMKQLQASQTVQDILQNYKLTASRMNKSLGINTASTKSFTSILKQQYPPSRSQNLLYSSSLSTLKSSYSPNIKDALNANERAERVAQILALAKAKSFKMKALPNTDIQEPIDTNSVQDENKIDVNRNLFSTQAYNDNEENEPLLNEDVTANVLAATTGHLGIKMSTVPRKSNRYSLDE